MATDESSLVPLSAAPTAGRVRIQRLEMRGITKRFPGVLANTNVNFDVNAGEVHALLGENGAGKSTLMRQLYGLYQPDEGQVLIGGTPVHFRNPRDAIGRGPSDVTAWRANAPTRSAWKS